MPELVITTKAYKCSRCLYEWIPRNKLKKPICCPGCQSPYWDVPKLS